MYQCTYGTCTCTYMYMYMYMYMYTVSLYQSLCLCVDRECTVPDQGYERLMSAMTKCKSILQLNLNLGVVNSPQRAMALASTLDQNRSLTALL